MADMPISLDSVVKVPPVSILYNSPQHGRERLTVLPTLIQERQQQKLTNCLGNKAMGIPTNISISSNTDRDSYYTLETSKPTWDGCPVEYGLDLSLNVIELLAYTPSSQGNTSLLSTAGEAKKSERRQMAMISALIDHPKDGLILYELGAGKDYPTVWGAPLNDIFARVNYVRDSLESL